LDHLLEQARSVHFVGIGGIGLSAIARVLHARGYTVSGSDAQRTALTEKLDSLGMTVTIGHRAEHVRGADLIIASSAVPQDNPEILAGQQAGIPVVKRAQILGEMMAGKTSIAVAGTHGKTTTSALIAFVLTEAHLDPSYVVGGMLQDFGSNARHGNGPHFVIEADEYDHTFLGLLPSIAVVTVIEMDHPDCFRDLDEITGAFERFLHQLPDDGVAVGCADQRRVRQLLARLHHDRGIEIVTYGLELEADWTADKVQPNAWGGSDFEVMRRGVSVGRCGLRLTGLHNVANALAALAVIDRLELDMKLVLPLVSRFAGVTRRFELKGESKGIAVVDDYAHHPTEIRATLAAARRRYGRRPIWAFFQPHTYSRTKVLLNEFAASFDDADHVIVSEIYAAREQNSLGISARDLVKLMKHRDVRLVTTLQEAVDVLCAALRPGDVLLTLGAGDGYRVGEAVLCALRGDVERGDRVTGCQVLDGSVFHKAVNSGS